MNINHNHTNATKSEEADELEKDIESIQNYLVLLFDELRNRIRVFLNIRPLLVKYKLPIIFGIIIISRLMFPSRSKKRPVVNKTRKNLKLSRNCLYNGVLK